MDSRSTVRDKITKLVLKGMSIKKALDLIERPEVKDVDKDITASEETLAEMAIHK